MPREPRRRGVTPEPRDGPVTPGTPLYRMLRMIARLVAEGGPGRRPPAGPTTARKRRDSEGQT